MKAIIFGILLAAFTATVNAHDKVDFWDNVDLKPSMRIGGDPGNNGLNDIKGDTNVFIFAVDDKNCKGGCLSPFIATISNNHGKSIGVGLDYVYKLKSDNGAVLNIAFGGVRFDQPLNEGQQNNIHIGLSLTMPLGKDLGLIVAYDRFENGDALFNHTDYNTNVPLDSFSIGIQF